MRFLLEPNKSTVVVLADLRVATEERVLRIWSYETKC